MSQKCFTKCFLLGKELISICFTFFLLLIKSRRILKIGKNNIIKLLKSFLTNNQ